MNAHQGKKHHAHEQKYKAQFDRTKKNKLRSIKRGLLKNPNNILAKQTLEKLESVK